MSRRALASFGSWQRYGDKALRILAAIPIGYGVASLWALALARLLPGERSQATLVAALVALLICAGTAMWAFAARSGWRALWTLLVAGATAGGLAWLSIAIGGRI